MLFVAGEPSHSLYFICSGRVKVYRAAADGIQVDLQLSRQELGQLIGASRETVKRVLQQFQREDAIRTTRPCSF